MIKKITFIIALFILCQAPMAYGQDKITLSGFIKDKASDETLIGATVFIRSEQLGTATNAYGFYSLSVPPGEYTVEYSFVGYETKEIQVKLEADVTQSVRLGAASVEINAVTVSSKSRNQNIKKTQTSVVQMDAKTLKKLPVLLGEPDLMKSIQIMPGIQTPVEGSTGFSVRGGSMDQNLILLDEAPVYNPSHLLGFFSVFNGDAIKDVTLYKGDIPASAGGRLSSLLDVRMREGNRQKFRASGGIGLISSRLTLEGPIKKNKGSFIISGRRTYADLFLKMSSDSTIRKNKLFFYDFNLKANYSLNDNNRFYISGYFGRDQYRHGSKIGFRWGNATFTARWNHLFSSKLFSNLTLIYSKYNYKMEMKRQTPEYDWTSRLVNFSAKYDFSWYMSPNNTVRFGAQATRHFIQPGKFTISGEESDYKVPNNKALEYAVYLQQEQKIGTKFSYNLGLRVSAFQNIDSATVYKIENFEVTDAIHYGKNKIYNTYVRLDPRFSARYLINEENSLKASYCRTHQYVQLASNSQGGSPLDVWFPASKYVKPQVSDQVSVGWFRNFDRNRWEASVELFHKWMDNQIDFDANANLLLNNQLEKELRFGEAKSYGAEFLLKKNEGKLTGFIGYTWSKTVRKFPDINDGKEYRANYDIPHNINVMLSYKISKRVSVSTVWNYRSGVPVTYPVMRFLHGGSSLPIYKYKNNERMPDYHRLDLSMTIGNKEKPGKKWEGEWKIGVYNAYNRGNAYSVYFEQDSKNTNHMKAYKMVMFRAVPFISYNFKF